MAKQSEHILLEPEQKERLQAASDNTGIPKDEIIQMALDQYFEDDEWDRQMKRDLKAGRLDDIIARAKEQSRKGQATPL